VARPLTLDEAVRFALEHHPVVEGAVARLAAAHAGVELAEASRLPSLDVVAQLNRATGNAVAGSLFATPGVPGTSGPVGSKLFDGGAWGTTAGLVSAFPLTGLLRANRLTHARQSAERTAEAGEDATRLDVAFFAASAYLRAMAAAVTGRAAAAGAARAQTLLDMTEPLVTQQLRPGADLARARAELANAEIDVARAARERAVAEASLGDALGSEQPVAVGDTAIVLGPALRLTPGAAGHPAVREAEDAVQAANGERALAALGWWPRVDLVGALWERASGVPVNGVVAPAMQDGLNPNVSNWAVGLSFSWPLLGLSSTAADVRRAEAASAAAAARLRVTADALTAARRAAEADTAGAMAIAQRTRLALDAARAALDQAMARYQAGLTSVTDVADTQRLLARAEAADAVALIDVKLSRLALARAAGDLQALLGEVRGGTTR
jgi:outer membrane protein TolC